MKVLVSPDRTRIAFASDPSITAEDMAFGMMDKKHGGAWVSAAYVAGWTEVDVPDAPTPPAQQGSAPTATSAKSSLV